MHPWVGVHKNRDKVQFVMLAFKAKTFLCNKKTKLFTKKVSIGYQEALITLLAIDSENFSTLQLTTD